MDDTYSSYVFLRAWVHDKLSQTNIKARVHDMLSHINIKEGRPLGYLSDIRHSVFESTVLPLILKKRYVGLCVKVLEVCSVHTRQRDTR